MNIYQEILELDELAKSQGGKYSQKRFLYKKLQEFVSKPVKHMKGIIGPRGVGKTVLLKQIRKKNDNSIYLSLDSFSQTLDLFKVVKEISDKYKTNLFLLDEIHFLDNFSAV